VKLDTLIGEPWADYGLVDSGHGRKLERYGRYRFVRPEPQAMWAPAAEHWDADGEFIPGSDEEGRRPLAIRPPGARAEAGTSLGRKSPSAPNARRSATSLLPDMAPQWPGCAATGDGHERSTCSAIPRRTLAMAGAGARMVMSMRPRKSVEAGQGQCGLSAWADRPIRWLVEVPQVRGPRGAPRPAL
jgi:23S rRNA (cytosine1962-C5)-methyltransferase